MAKIDHSSIRLFSIGVPVMASLKPAGISRAAWWPCVARFFTNWASSRISPAQSDVRIRLGIEAQQRIGRHHDVVVLGELGQRRGGARLRVGDRRDLQARREACRLVLPVGHHGGGCDHQERRRGSRPGSSGWFCGFAQICGRAGSAPGSAASCPGPCHRPARRPGRCRHRMPASRSPRPGRGAAWRRACPAIAPERSP